MGLPELSRGYSLLLERWVGYPRKSDSRLA